MSFVYKSHIKMKHNQCSFVLGESLDCSFPFENSSIRVLLLYRPPAGNKKGLIAKLGAYLPDLVLAKSESFEVFVSKLWNELPVHIKSSTSVLYYGKQL